MLSRFTSSRPDFPKISRYIESRRPELEKISRYVTSRRGLAVTSAATAAVTAAGLGIGLTVGSSPAAASAPAAVSRVSAPPAAGHARQVTSAASHPTGGTAAHAAAHAVPAQGARHASVRVSATAAHSASARPAARPAHAATAHRASQARRARPHRPVWNKPFLIYDSVTPAAIPAHHLVATYATGPFAVQGSAVAGRNVMWIDTTGTDPHANALDIEPSDATPAMAAAWTRQKLSADPRSDAVLYTMVSEWPAVRAEIGTLPRWMQHHVRWWIADPTGYPHVIRGANATQWYWGKSYDITTANPGF